MRPPVILLGKSMFMVLALAGGTVGMQLFTYGTGSDDNDVLHERRFREGYNVFSLNQPTDLDFCGEPVPMELLDVRERMDRELLVNTYWQSNSLLALKRANRWFPVIEEILEREGLPNDLKYIPLVESNLTNAVSQYLGPERTHASFESFAAAKHRWKTH